jgi:hypothetical protein
MLRLRCVCPARVRVRVQDQLPNLPPGYDTIHTPKTKSEKRARRRKRRDRSVRRARDNMCRGHVRSADDSFVDMSTDVETGARCALWADTHAEVDFSRADTSTRRCVQSERRCCCRWGCSCHSCVGAFVHFCSPWYGRGARGMPLPRAHEGDSRVLAWCGSPEGSCAGGTRHTRDNACICVRRH